MEKQKSAGRRKQLFSIVIMLIGLLLMLCIVSYHPEDESASDLSFERITHLLLRNDTYRIGNWMGILGALTAEFFVKGAFGYFSVVFPALLTLWGWMLLRRRSIFSILPFTNYALLFTLLLSTAAGTAKHIFPEVPSELTGNTGYMLASILANLFGEAGSAIILMVSLCLAFIFAVDIDVYASFERLRRLFTGVADNFTRKEPPVTINVNQEERFVHARPAMTVHHIESEVEQQQTVGGEVVRETETEAVFEPPEEAEPPTPGLDEGIEEIEYVFPSVELLEPQRLAETVGEDELKANAELLRDKLEKFSVMIENVSVTPGPVVTLYELVPASDVKISRIVSLADDLALALAAKGIRIIAPIPGKSAVGVEIPNHHPSIVTVRSVINSPRFRDSKSSLPLALGKTISGDVYVDDLSRMPHLLIAGATGSGKSVGINTIIASLLYKMEPWKVKFVVIDPKKIELALYTKLRNHFLATSPDIREEIITTPQNSVAMLKSVELEMEKRYDRLAAAGVRNLQDYNERLKSGRLRDNDTVKHRPMPYLVVIIDELADLMMTAARDVEEPIARLAQLARAVGIHLVVATQRPSVDVITGVIKANFSARIAYQVSSKVDSRTILDMNGAEQLLGNGDMLYLAAGSSKPIRLQNAFISTDEVERIVEHIAHQQGYSKPFTLPSITERKKNGLGSGSGERDELFDEAARIVVRHQQGSVSLLQRRLKVGYSRAARLVDELEAAGIVGPYDGSKAREVLIESEEELDNYLRDNL
jgi:S-DNA-T family DNA segregation ATPase FtsK/SpoIIIE